VRRMLGLLGLLLAVPAAVALTCVYVPAPVLPLAHLGMIAAEKSVWVLTVGLVALLLGWVRFQPGGRLAAATLVLLGFFLVGGSAPLVIAAYRTAHGRAAPLALERWLEGGFDAGHGLPPNARSIVYRTVDGHPLALDAWTPAGGHQPATPIVVIHGGGWSAGERSEMIHTDAWLASRGYAVFDIDYRLTTTTTGLGVLADVRCALAWLKTNARAEGFVIGLDRVVLLGRSAGGHLALLAGYGESEAGKPTGCDASGITIAGVVALYPITDLASAYAAPANRAAYPLDEKIRTFVGSPPHGHEAVYRALSPLTHVGRHTPPTLLLHGARDQVVPLSQSRLLAEALATAGVAHDLLVLPWAGHGFDFVVDGPGDQLMQTVVLQFLRELPAMKRVSPSGRTSVD